MTLKEQLEAEALKNDFYGSNEKKYYKLALNSCVVRMLEEALSYYNEDPDIIKALAELQKLREELK